MKNYMDLKKLQGFYSKLYELKLNINCIESEHPEIWKIN